MKTLVLDSSIWVEYFADRPKARAIESFIQDPARLVVPAVAIYEVYKRIKIGIGKEAAEAAVGRMLMSRVMPIDSDLALQAADLSIETKLAMGDALVLATARACGGELITLDSDFKGLPGARVI